MIEIDKNGTKVDLEFNFVSLRLGINFPCMISICVSTNCKTGETEAIEFTVNSEFRSPVNRKLRTSAVLFPHKINQADLNVTIITKRGRKSAGLVKFDINKVLNSNIAETTELLINCPDKYATITFGVKIDKLVHLSINDAITKSPLKKLKTGASFYSVANYGQDVSTNQSKQLNNSSYSLNINKKDGRSQSPAHNVIFKFQSKKAEVDEQQDNWSKQLPSSKDLNNSVKLEDSVLKNVDEYKMRKIKLKNDHLTKATNNGDLEIKRPLTSKREKETNSATKAVRDDLISDLKTQIANLAFEKNILHQKMTELNVEYTIMMKENIKFKEDNAKYHKQISQYKAIDVDELLSNYDIIKGQYERAIKDLDKQEEELYELRKQLEDKIHKVGSLEKIASRRSSELSDSIIKNTRPLSHNWANRLGSLEKDQNIIHARFAHMYAIDSEDDINTFDQRFREQLEKEEIFENKIQGLEEDKAFLEIKVEEQDKKIDVLEGELQKIEYELQSERVDSNKKELELKSKIANDAEEWEIKFTNLANEYKATIVKLKDNNVNLQKRYEEILNNSDINRLINQKDYGAKFEDYVLRINKLEIICKHIEDVYITDLNTKTIKIKNVERSINDVAYKYKQETLELSRQMEIMSKTEVKRENLYQQKLESVKNQIWDLENEVIHRTIEKIYSEKYVEYVFDYIEDHDNEHIKSMNRLIDTFKNENTVRKEFWDKYKSSTDKELDDLKKKYKNQRSDLLDELARLKDRYACGMEEKAIQKASISDQVLQYQNSEAELLSYLSKYAGKKREYKRVLNETSFSKRNLLIQNTSVYSNYEIILTDLDGENTTLKEKNSKFEKVNEDIQVHSEPNGIVNNKYSVTIHEISEKIKDMDMQLYALSEDIETIICINKKLKNSMINKLKKQEYSAMTAIGSLQHKLAAFNDKIIRTSGIIRNYEDKIKNLEDNVAGTIKDSKCEADKIISNLKNDYKTKILDMEMQIQDKNDQNKKYQKKSLLVNNKLWNFYNRLGDINIRINNVTSGNITSLFNKMIHLEEIFHKNRNYLNNIIALHTQKEQAYDIKIKDFENQMSDATAKIKQIGKVLTFDKNNSEVTLDLTDNKTVITENMSNESLLSNFSIQIETLLYSMHDFSNQMNSKNNEIEKLKLEHQQFTNTYNEKISTYEGIIEDYKAQTDLYEDTLKEYENEVIALKEKINALEQSGGEQSQELSFLLNRKEEELVKAIEKYHVLEKEYKQLEETKASRINSLNDKINQLEAELNNKMEELSIKTNMLDALNFETQNKNASDNKIAVLNTQLEEKVRALENDYQNNLICSKKLNDEIVKLNNELKEHDDKIEVIKNELIVKNEKISKYRSKKQVFKNQISDLNKTEAEKTLIISHQANEIVSLTAQINNHERSFNDTSVNIQIVQQQLTDLKNQNDVHVKEIVELNHKLELKSSKIEHLKEQLNQDKDKKNEYVTELQDKLEKIKQESLVLQEELSQQKIQIGKLETASNLHLKENEELRSQIQFKEIEHNESIKNMQLQFEDREKTQKHDSENLDKEISKLSSDFSKLTYENEKLKEEITSSKSNSEVKNQELIALSDKVKQYKEAIQEAENTIQLKSNDIRHFEAQLLERKNQVDQLTTSIRDIERKYSELEKEYMEFKHNHQSETESYDHLITENEILKQNAKFMESKSVDAKVVEKLTNKIEDLEKQLSRTQNEAEKEQSNLNMTIRTIREELNKKAGCVEVEIYQQIEKAYIESMQKIGDALNIVKSLKLKQNDKDKIIASLIV